MLAVVQDLSDSSAFHDGRSRYSEENDDVSFGVGDSLGRGREDLEMPAEGKRGTEGAVTGDPGEVDGQATPSS